MLNINVNQLGPKVRSKHKMYRILTVDAKLYLRPQKECSIYFIRDFLQRKKVLNH